MKTMQVAVLNVVMPLPHGPFRYVELFKQSLRLHRAVDLRGDYKGMIGGARGDESSMQGELYKFFDLNPDAEWFNLSKQQQAKEDELAGIRIPENLKPHHHSFDFIFLPKDHRLMFVSRDSNESISPQTVQKLLEGIFGQPEIVERFGAIQITVEPKRERLTALLALPRLKVLKIEVKPPNPDDLEEAERDVLGRMTRQRADKLTIELKTSHPEGLAPDDDYERLAAVAQSNGKVTGKGVNSQGRTVEMSTSDHPLIVPVHFDPDVELRSAALFRASTEVMKKIRDGR